MLKYRLITGPLLILAILGIVWLDTAIERWPLAATFGAWSTSFANVFGWTSETAPPGVALFVAALVIVPLMARETARMVESVGIAASRRFSMSFATLTYVVCVLLPWLPDARAAASLAATWALVLFVAGLLRFSRGQNVKGVLAATGALLLVCVYSGVLISFWLLLRHDHSAWVLVGAILTTKSCDTGAYFTGIAIGRHKMIEWLSPKKTWEGLVGGVATAAVVGTLLALWSHHLPHPNDHLPWWIGTIGGVLVALVGQFGDLAESLFKRDAGLKDSGRLLPGMGGVLDVLDSPLMTGPVVYWLLALALPRG